MAGVLLRRAAGAVRTVPTSWRSNVSLFSHRCLRVLEDWICRWQCHISAHSRDPDQARTSNRDCRSTFLSWPDIQFVFRLRVSTVRAYRTQAIALEFIH